MLPIIEFLKVFSGMLRSGKMSYSDALTRFRAQFGRTPDGLELSSIRKEVEKAPSNVFDSTGRRIDTNRPIIGGKNVAETEAQVKARMLKTQEETLKRLRTVSSAFSRIEQVLIRIKSDSSIFRVGRKPASPRIDATISLSLKFIWQP